MSWVLTAVSNVSYSSIQQRVLSNRIALPPNTFISTNGNWSQRSHILELAETKAKEIHSYARSSDHLTNHQTRGRHNVLASSLDHFPSDVNTSRFTNLFPLPTGSTWLHTPGATCSTVNNTHSFVILFRHVCNHNEQEEIQNSLHIRQ